MKKKENVGVMKLSKSASDITQGILDRKGDFRCIQSRLGTRSLSHDSIFLSVQHQSDPEPKWVLSQENVSGKIQALQMKLQMQKMHLGPPPQVLPLKQSENYQHPTEVLTLSKCLPHKLKSSSQGILPQTIIPTQPPFYSSAPSTGVDFSTLPQFIPCLDNSAARHRMSIKPRNQRASTKSRRIPTSDGSRPRSESMIILERPLTDDRIAVTKEITRVRSYSSQIIRPGKGLIAPPTKSPCPASPLKLLVGANDDSHPCAMSQCKGKEESVVSKTANVGAKEILNSAEGMVVKSPSSAGPTSHKESGDHKDSLYSSKPKGFESSVGSNISSAYTPCLILSDTEQSQLKTDRELNSLTTHVKGIPLDRNRVQVTMQESYFKPLLLHRNTSPLDRKSEGRNVQQICSLPLSRDEACLQLSTTQQGSLSFSVSSDKCHEMQRTGSFTGQMEQAGGKQELRFPLIKPSSTFKTQDPDINAQVKPTWKDPSQTRTTSTPAVSTKPKDLTITLLSIGQERRDSPANKTREMAVETHERVEEADEKNKELKMNEDSQEQKEDWSACEVKLHTTSQSEVTDKQHNTEVRRTTESNTPIGVDHNDIKVGPVRETVLRSPPLYNTELFVSAESHEFFSKRPQSARRDQDRPGLNRFADLQASEHLADSTINITVGTPAGVREKGPLLTSAKESKEVSTELSWMTMAREKTRSLQQLFTSTLNDLAGLQTATRPAASPITQISSQPSAGPLRPKHQVPSTQPIVSPSETQLPPVHAFLRATHPAQPPPLKSSISLAQPSTGQSGGVEFSLKQTLSPTNQIQPTYLSGRPGEMSTNSATKTVHSTGISQIMNAAQPQLSEMSIQHVFPIQQTLSQSVTKTQASQSLRLSLSPKLTPYQSIHQSPSPLLQHRPLVENVSSLPLGKVDRTSMSQGKSLTESQAQCAGGMGSQALLTEQQHHQKRDAVKVVDQKSTPDSQMYTSLDEFLTISSRRKLTELAVSPRPMRLDREVKWQKKTFPPPSNPSSCLQSNSDSRPPSWMELAKRKSMAWSDKTMD